jgi:hypothetical protein
VNCRTAPDPDRQRLEEAVGLLHQHVMESGLDPMFDPVDVVAEEICRESDLPFQKMLPLYLRWALPSSACQF